MVAILYAQYKNKDKTLKYLKFKLDTSNTNELKYIKLDLQTRGLSDNFEYLRNDPDFIKIIE